MYQESKTPVSRSKYNKAAASSTMAPLGLQQLCSTNNKEKATTKKHSGEKKFSCHSLASSLATWYCSLCITCPQENIWFCRSYLETEKCTHRHFLQWQSYVLHHEVSDTKVNKRNPNLLDKDILVHTNISTNCKNDREMAVINLKKNSRGKS